MEPYFWQRPKQIIELKNVRDISMAEALWKIAYKRWYDNIVTRAKWWNVEIGHRTMYKSKMT